jgi:hypothetical protein
MDVRRSAVSALRGRNIHAPQGESSVIQMTCPSTRKQGEGLLGKATLLSALHCDQKRAKDRSEAGIWLIEERRW